MFLHVPICHRDLGLALSPPLTEVTPPGASHPNGPDGRAQPPKSERTRWRPRADVFWGQRMNHTTSLYLYRKHLVATRHICSVGPCSHNPIPKKTRNLFQRMGGDVRVLQQFGSSQDHPHILRIHLGHHQAFHLATKGSVSLGRQLQIVFTSAFGGLGEPISRIKHGVSSSRRGR